MSPNGQGLFMSQKELYLKLLDLFLKIIYFIIEDLLN